MAFDTKNFTGTVASGTALVASAATKQIRVKKIIVSVGKAASGKQLQFSTEGAAKFFKVDLGNTGVHKFDPRACLGDDFVLAKNKDLDYESDAGAGTTNVSIVTNYHIQEVG